ncbi:uncharacterized protein LOC134727779 [Mytilus trossulus]|uniref:uncharacterized protein LOC134727779 n=1 Tax=Mytilus trossulus TaxID=6551 RepID=UPI0030066A5D
MEEEPSTSGVKKRSFPKELLDKMDDTDAKLPRVAATPAVLNDNQKRYLVVGLCLQNVISPALRKYVVPILTSLYEELTLKEKIDTQTFSTRYQPTYIFLNYENINNNKATHGYQKAKYDYTIKSVVDLSKLFLPIHMAHYTDFDETCDLSALLGLIINIVGKFPTAVIAYAKNVRGVRNEWAHSDFTKWDAVKYSDSFKLMTDIVKNLCLSSNEESQTLLELEKWEINGTSSLNDTNEICQLLHVLVKSVKHIANESDNTSAEINRLLTIVENQDTLLDEVIPIHILEQFEKRFEQWKKDDQQFVSTEAEKHVMQKVLTQSSVTLVGNSGTGKSFLSKHIALIMKKHGYTVIPCSKPKDIGKWFKHGRKTLFVFDDVCGRYTLNQQIYTDWKQRLDHIISLLEDTCCKIISTCRLEVYKDEVFSNLSIFKMCNIDLSSQEFKLSAAEKFALAEVYLKENTDKVKELSEKYDFFPLLCSLYYKQNLQKNVSVTSFFSNPFEVFKDQLVQMYGESDAGKMQYCSLVLCVMFNNTLTEENLSPKDKKIGAMIEDLLEECELNKGTSIKRLKKALETLEGTYVVKEGTTYKIIHDKLFDFLAKYFGEKMLQIFIDHAHTDFIEERFLWKITDNMGTEIEFVIRIPDTHIDKYIDRLVKDWENCYVNNVCHNRNMNSTTFTEILVTHLNELDLSKQEELVCTKDIDDKDIALSECCYMGTIDLVKWLISRNSDINYCGEDGWFPLYWASQEGHVDVVKELLQHSAEINKCSNNGTSPLYMATDVNKCTNEDASPLYIASQNGHVDAVKELLQHSADVNKCNNNDVSPLYITTDVNKCDNNGVSPLYIASQTGHVDVVKDLLQHSADVNKCRNDGTPPLQIACYNNMIEVVRVLLQCDDVDIDLCDDNGCSSLYIATDVNKCDNNGVSPLYIASQTGHVDVVKDLLQHSADVNKCRNDGTPPLQIACYNNMIEVVRVLLQCDDVDIDLCDDNGCSSLYIASQKGHVDVVKELLQHSADVNKCKHNGVSPLYIASRHGHVNIVKELLQHSADVNKCMNDGIPPLQIACYNNRIEVVRVLLQCDDVDIDLCDDNGCSSLYIASQKGHVDVVKDLLQHSADVNKCDFKGKNPLNVAQEQGHIEIESLLKGKGINQH